jgi:hypothetical protein
MLRTCATISPDLTSYTVSIGSRGSSIKRAFATFTPAILFGCFFSRLLNASVSALEKSVSLNKGKIVGTMRNKVSQTFKFKCLLIFEVD